MHKERVRDIPLLPGVYLFKDHTNTIIYVGKAKCLRKRVSSYFQKQDTDWKVAELIKAHATIEHIVTKNETEALLLEAQLIRDYKPKYNVLLKSGNPFLYLVFTESEDIPQLKIVRVKKEKGTYFGPFLHKQDARSVFAYLTRTFTLYLCNVKISQGCLEYHLGHCAGNCMDQFNMKDYMLRLMLAQQALEGNHKAFLQAVQENIALHNQNLEFEKSRHLASYLKNLDIIFATIKTRYTEKKYSKEIEYATKPLRRAENALQAGLAELATMLELQNIPTTIDCFDISHFQSTYIVGSCIRFTNGKPDKNKFRRFKIKSLESQNDYAALQEIVRRRYREEDFPDIILIDGGKGQRNAIKDLFPHVTCISLAKREEQVFADNHPEGLRLDLTTTIGQLLIALRDYAHHFAIEYHKLLRKKGIRANAHKISVKLKNDTLVSE